MHDNQRRLRPSTITAIALTAAAALAPTVASAQSPGATVATATSASSDALAAETRWSVRAEGPFSPAQLGLPAGASRSTLARAAIEQSAGDLGLSRKRLGRLTAGPSFGPPGAGARVLRFRQSVGGLRVLWSQLNVTVGHGSVAGIMGTVVPLRDTKLRGSVMVGSERARRIARRRVAGADSARRPELVAYAGEPEKPRSPRRAYVVEVNPTRTEERDDSPIGFCVVVDATSGKVVKVWRGSAAQPAERASVQARAAQANTVLAQYADAKGNASNALPSNGYDLVTPSNPFTNFDQGAFLNKFGSPTALTAGGSPPFRSAIDTFTEVARFFCRPPRRYCGRDGGGRPHGYARHFLTINWGGSPAKYRGSQERIYIPAGVGDNWEIAAHELGHSIDFHNRDDFLQTFEADEVEEALGEMFSYDFANGRPAPPGAVASITTILEDPRDAPVQMSHGPGQGNVDLPSHYSQYYCNTTEEHLNGYILGHAYYNFVQRVGREEAAQVLMFVPFLLPARREFGDVREAMEDAADILFKQPNETESFEANQVDISFNEVGVQDASRRTDRCPGATP
jgi:hypothetical protein